MVGRIYRSTIGGRKRQPERSDLNSGSTEYTSTKMTGTYRARKMHDKMSPIAKYRGAKAVTGAKRRVKL